MKHYDYHHQSKSGKYNPDGEWDNKKKETRETRPRSKTKKSN